MAQDYHWWRKPNKQYSVVKTQVVDINSDTDTILIGGLEEGGGQPAKRILVIGGMLTFASGAGTHVWKSGENAISGPMGMGIQPFGIMLPYNPAGWLETEPGESLVVTTDDGCTIAGFLRYVEETE